MFIRSLEGSMVMRWIALFQFLLWFPVLASAQNLCERIDVNCQAMTMVIDNGAPTRISCGGGPQGRCGGDGLTATCTGKLGGEHNGDVVKRGVRIENCAGMGDSGGGKVFHLGNTSAHSSCGCIHVSKPDLDKLLACGRAGTNRVLNISGNGGSTQEISHERRGDGGYSRQRIDEAKKSGEIIGTEGEDDGDSGSDGNSGDGAKPDPTPPPI